jgi:hypothetical protein
MTSKEQVFRKVAPLTGVFDLQRFPLAQNYPQHPTLVSIAPADMTVEQARQLRNWLNAALPDETTEVTKLHETFQEVMALLADMLDADNFNNIEQRVLDAGVPYPPPVKAGADPAKRCQHDLLNAACDSALTDSL